MNKNAAPEAFFTATQISAGYQDHTVVQDISFALPAGTLTGLLGINGSGKTTLLKALCGLLPHTGSCTLSGAPLESLTTKQRALLLSYIPQRSGITLSLSALEVVMMGFHARLGLLQAPSKAQRHMAQEALERVGIASLQDRDYQTLSEGQKQLCILARTLVEDTKLLLLDEPDSALDFPNRHAMLRLLQDILQNQSRSALLCLHDPLLALEYCDQLLLLKDGKCLAALHPREDSLEDMEAALQLIYGRVQLIRCDGKGRKPHLVLLPA